MMELIDLRLIEKNDSDFMAISEKQCRSLSYLDFTVDISIQHQSQLWCMLHECIALKHHTIRTPNLLWPNCEGSVTQ